MSDREQLGQILYDLKGLRRKGRARPGFIAKDHQVCDGEHDSRNKRKYAGKEHDVDDEAVCERCCNPTFRLVSYASQARNASCRITSATRGELTCWNYCAECISWYLI
jgi:hypothetical protein